MIALPAAQTTPAHKHRAHALCLLLIGAWVWFLAITPSTAWSNAETATDSAWSQWLAQDLEATRDLLDKHYIYAYTRHGEPEWDALVESAFANAEAAREGVSNLAGYQAVIQTLLSEFRDAHLRARFALTSQPLLWPGFLLRYQMGQYRVVHSTHPHIPNGAIVSQCDGRSLDAWIDERAPSFNHLPGLAATYEWLAPEALVFSASLDEPKPDACQINGQSIQLSYQRTNHDRLHPMQQVSDQARPKLGLTRIDDDLAWIRLPAMAPQNALEAEAFHEVIAQAPSLRDTPQVVLDVRGNRGGPYPWFMAILRGLYGPSYVDHHAIDRLMIRPLFVEGSYQRPAGDPRSPDPFNTPEDAPLNRTIAEVKDITLANGQTVIALEPQGERYQRPEDPGPSLFNGQLYVLTDGRCASACLSMIDELKRLGQVIHIGTPTWVDRRSGSSRPHELPSGLTTLFIPSMLREHRVRDDNVAHIPDQTLPVDTQDSQAVMAWLKSQATDTPLVQISELASPPIRQTHTGQFNGQGVDFDSVVESFLIQDQAGRPQATLYTFSYLADSQDSERPVLFVFQGGPGSSSVWSHLGLLGPKRIRFDDPAKPQTVPPFVFEDNPYSLLDVADLVFIDPVFTGFSRASSQETSTDLLSTQEDARAVADVIQQWLTRHQGWNRPRYVMGSSFGTTRAIEVANTLMGGVFPPHGQLGSVTLNGLIILGPVFSRQEPFAGNHRAFQTILPTYAAIAWYHGRLGPEWTSVEAVVEAASTLAWGAYDDGLDQGQLLPQEKRNELAIALAQLTGIDAETWIEHDLKIDRDTFRGLVLADQNLSVGRFDGRFVLQGHLENADPVVDDAAMGQYTPAFIDTFNHYLSDYLGVETDLRYQSIDWTQVNFQWDYGWGPGIQRPRNDAETLAKVQRRTPMLRVFIGAGYYDLGTPFAGAEYSLAHVPLDRERLIFELYPSGHSPYLGEENIRALSQDLRRFITP